MKIISQDYLPVRTFILIGMVLLTTTQTYAQNINTRLSFTLKNATLKEFVKLIENSTGILLSMVKKWVSGTKLH